MTSAALLQPQTRPVSAVPLCALVERLWGMSAIGPKPLKDLPILVSTSTNEHLMLCQAYDPFNSNVNF